MNFNLLVKSTDAIGVGFNAHLGHPQISVVIERGKERFMRRFTMSAIRPREVTCILTYQDYYSPDWHEQAPQSVCHLRDDSVAEKIERVFSQIRTAATGYLKSATAQTERDLCTAIELSSL